MPEVGAAPPPATGAPVGADAPEAGAPPAGPSPWAARRGGTIFLSQMPGTGDSYAIYRFTLRTKILANGEDPAATVLYLTALDEETTTDGALVRDRFVRTFDLEKRPQMDKLDAMKKQETLKVFKPAGALFKRLLSSGGRK